MDIEIIKLCSLILMSKIRLPARRFSICMLSASRLRRHSCPTETDDNLYLRSVPLTTISILRLPVWEPQCRFTRQRADGGTIAVAATDASAELYPAERASSARPLINGEHRQPTREL
jgi:hypothetical protein